MIGKKRNIQVYHYLAKMDYQKNLDIQNRIREDEIKLDAKTSQLSQILVESRKFIVNFLDELKEKALTPISQEVINHYYGQIKQNYNVKDIISIIDKRISKQLVNDSTRMIRNKKIKKNWNLDDIILLLWFISKYMSFRDYLTCQKLGKSDWQFISKLIPGSTPKGCMFKFISLKKVKLCNFNWSQSEEIMLKQLVKQISFNLSDLGLNRLKQIAQYLYQNNPTFKIFRTPKQCRQHWNCYLDPRLKKGPWSQAEDVKLLKNVKQNKGQRRWSSIKSLFQGRTQNALKNRYNLLLERQRKLTPNKNETDLIKQYLKEKISSQTTIKSQNNPASNKLKVQIQSPKIQQQIFEQAIDQSKKKPMTAVEIQKNVKVETFMKSEKSSFRISEAFEKSKLYKQQASDQYSNFSAVMYNNLMLMSMRTMPSIMTNQPEFYRNLIFKPFYQG